jgi:hypothetical protein
MEVGNPSTPNNSNQVCFAKKESTKWNSPEVTVTTETKITLFEN